MVDGNLKVEPHRTTNSCLVKNWEDPGKQYLKLSFQVESWSSIKTPFEKYLKLLNTLRKAEEGFNQ